MFHRGVLKISHMYFLAEENYAISKNSGKFAIILCAQKYRDIGTVYHNE